MGWKDNCETCGGHPNSEGVLLHKIGCAAVTPMVTVPIKQPKPFMENFVEGTLINLVITECRHLMHVGGALVATGSMTEQAFENVVFRFEEFELDTAMVDRIINAAKGGINGA